MLHFYEIGRILKFLNVCLDNDDYDYDNGVDYERIAERLKMSYRDCVKYIRLLFNAGYVEERGIGYMITLKGLEYLFESKLIKQAFEKKINGERLI